MRIAAGPSTARAKNLRPLIRQIWQLPRQEVLIWTRVRSTWHQNWNKKTEQNQNPSPSSMRCLLRRPKKKFMTMILPSSHALPTREHEKPRLSAANEWQSRLTRPQALPSIPRSLKTPWPVFSVKIRRSHVAGASPCVRTSTSRHRSTRSKRWRRGWKKRI